MLPWGNIISHQSDFRLQSRFSAGAFTGARARDAQVREAWLEEEAGIEAGGVQRLVEAIRKALRHGYEPRLAESVRFVHLVNADFANIRVSVQPIGSFRNCLEGVGFTQHYDGREMSPEEAEGLRDGEGCATEDETDTVTPDPIVTCSKCHKRFRVSKAMA